MLYISIGEKSLSVLPGQLLSITTDPNISYQIIPEPSATTSAPVASAARQGDSLIVNYADGTRIAMQDYFINCTGDNACRLVLDNQELGTLLSLNIEKTIIEEPLRPIVEANIFMADETVDYSIMLEQSIANNLFENASLQADSNSISTGSKQDILNLKDIVTGNSSPVDNTAPSISIHASKLNLGIADSSTITFTLSESIVDFNLSNITVQGGTLSNFHGSGSLYFATFTQSGSQIPSINISAESFSDAAGNKNLASFGPLFSLDSQAPILTISATDVLISYLESTTITFTFSENVIGFSATDIIVTGGALSNWAGINNLYTATFTQDGTNTAPSVSVPSGAAQDPYGNLSEAGVSPVFSLDIIAPSLIISAPDTLIGVAESILVSFTFSEAINGFNVADINVAGGTLSDFSGAHANYTALFTQSGTDTPEITVNTDFVTDTAGNANINVISPVFSLDLMAPSLSINIADHNLTAGDSTLVTFTFSEPPIDFTLADIIADNAVLSSFTLTADTKIYTAILTPTAKLLDTTNNVTVSASYTDAAGNTGSSATSANYAIDNNYVPIITGAGDTLIYNEGDGAQLIDASLNLSDFDDSLMISASISIGSGFNSTEDLLSFVDSGAISGSYNAATGVLSLSGSATISEYQSALQSVTYTNNNNLNPSADDRTISWRVNDGHSDSIAATSTINIIAINSVPLMFSGQQKMAFDGNDDYLTFPTILQNQGLHDSNGNFLGMSIAASITMDAFNRFDRIIDFSEGGANNDNIYISNKWASSTLRYAVHDGSSYSSIDVRNFFTLSESVNLVINHASNGVVTIYRNGIEIDPNIYPITINNSPAPVPIIIPNPANVTRSDNLIGKSHAGGSTFFEGSMDNISLVARTLSEAEITTLSSGDYSGLNQDNATIFNYAFDDSNPLTDKSVQQNDATAFGSPQTFMSSASFVIGGPVILACAEIQLIDLDNTHLSSATSSISSGFVSAEDRLFFTNTADITGSYNTSTGVMTLTGSATVEQYQAALRSITYTNANRHNPDTTDRTISWRINDGIDNSQPVTTTLQLLSQPFEITLTANNNGSSVSGFNGSLEATLTDKFNYQPLNPIASSPDQHYRQTNVGFHSVEGNGVDAVLNFDLNAQFTQLSNNAFVIDLYGRDGYFTTDDDFDILIFDSSGTLLGSIDNLALPDTSTSHLRVNVSQLISPALVDSDTIGAFRIVAHDTTTTHAKNYFTLLEIRAANLVDISSEITLTANTTGSSTSGSAGSLAGTLTDAFIYQPANPTSQLPDQVYASSNGFVSIEAEGADAILNYDLNAHYTQNANNNLFVIDLYGLSPALAGDNDFDIKIFDAADNLLGTIEHLAIPDNAAAHLRVNVNQGLSIINDGDTIAKFSIIAHDAITGGGGNFFTLLEIRAAEITLATPIILDLDGDGIETTTQENGVSFDIDGDGIKEQSAWVGSDDALLVRDIDGDGQIKGANELFGSGTLLQDGTIASDGYAALADLDSNKDGVINAFDTLFNQLQTWRDINSDAMVQEGELSYLKDSNVAELNLLAKDTNQWQNDNLIGKQSQWTDTQGNNHQMADVWLNYAEHDEQTLNQIAVDLSVDENSKALLFSEDMYSRQTASKTALENNTDTAQGMESTAVNHEVIETSASDEAIRNASIVL